MILDNKSIKKIHCLGIGGIGVSVLAEFFFKKGYYVTGSDRQDNKNIHYLKKIGIDISLDNHIISQDIDLVIYTSAISHDNPGFLAAQKLGIPLISRGKILADIMQGYYSIAVAGSHGKTTTSGILAHLLLTDGRDPSFIVGGILNNQKSPAHLGCSDYLVAELDESDRSFLFAYPDIAIVTSIDTDHLEAYGGDFGRLQQALLSFLHHVPLQSTVILCIDDENLRTLLPNIKRNILTYGFHPSAMIRASNFKANGLLSHFTVERLGAAPLSLTLNMPGHHNALNALASVSAATLFQIKDDVLVKGLSNFPGMERRFYYWGSIPVQGGGQALLIEDYGHHPNEIRAVLLTVRQIWPARRLVVAFQPHRYTRTRDLINEFVEVLVEADICLLLDIYSSSEPPVDGISSRILYQILSKNTKKKSIFVPKIDLLPRHLQKIAQPNDVIILQGAGNIGSTAKCLMSDTLTIA